MAELSEAGLGKEQTAMLWELYQQATFLFEQPAKSFCMPCPLFLPPVQLIGRFLIVEGQGSTAILQRKYGSDINELSMPPLLAPTNTLSGSHNLECGRYRSLRYHKKGTAVDE